MATNAKSQEDVDAAALSGAKLAVIHFWASWSEPCKHMDTVLEALHKQHPAVMFLRVEAEEVEDVTEKYGVSMVPSFVLLKGGEVVDRLEGADPPGLTDKVARLATGASAGAAAPVVANSTAPGGSEADVTGRIKFLLASHPVILFMKGNATAPKCGFSRKVAEALQKLEAPFHTVDILQDEPLRQGLKTYSDWPTYPQLYIKGELVGGCDIILEMAESGDLKASLKESLGANYHENAKVTCNEEAPAATPALAPAAQQQEGADLEGRIKALLNQKPVMLFMKGSPAEPRCGFSSKVVAALQSLSVDFGHFDILSDESIRQGLKEYSKWPTYPQLYVAGELLGGCDIVLEMRDTEDLKPTIDEMLSRLETV